MELEVATWKERFREHLKKRGLSERTALGYGLEVGRLLEFLASRGLESLGRLTPSLLADYRRHLFYRRYRGRGLRLSSQNRCLAAVKAFTRFLLRDGYLLSDVGAGLEFARKPELLPRVILSEGEVLELLEAPELATPMGVRDRAVLELLYSTGIRNQELCDLRLDQVELERLELRVVSKRKSRVVPMGEEAAGWLEEYLVRVRPVLLRGSSGAIVFLSSRGRALQNATLARLVVAWARAAGLKKKVTPHVLRHSCATHMLARGADLRHLQKFLGHSSTDTTTLYTRVEIGDLHAVLRRCHPRERGRR